MIPPRRLLVGKMRARLVELEARFGPIPRPKGVLVVDPALHALKIGLDALNDVRQQNGRSIQTQEEADPELLVDCGTLAFLYSRYKDAPTHEVRDYGLDLARRIEAKVHSG